MAIFFCQGSKQVCIPFSDTEYVFLDLALLVEILKESLFHLMTILKCIIDLYLFRGKKLFCAFIDYKKAFDQGRRRFLKSGTAIERHRRSSRAEGPSGGRARGGGG